MLDNFEQLTEAGPQLIELLELCPELRILVTSRAVLQLTGEHELKITPMAVPDLKQSPSFDELAQYDAVQLFVERAKAIMPNPRFCGILRERSGHWIRSWYRCGAPPSTRPVQTFFSGG